MSDALVIEPAVIRRPAPALIVAGLGRCGTSLLCQMLDAAGVPTCGTYPDFEVAELNRGRLTAARIDEHAGQAFKVLDPHKVGIDPSGRFVSIFLTRDRAEQARSIVKFVGGPRLNRGEVRRWSKNLLLDEHAARRSLAGRPIFDPTFEALLDGQIDDLATWLVGWNFRPPDVEKMKRQVVPRSAACQPSLEIEADLIAIRDAGLA